MQPGLGCHGIRHAGSGDSREAVDHFWAPDPCVVSCSRAQAANASGVLISAAAGGDVEIMDCRGGECALPLSIPAAMIPLRAASKLQVPA